MGSTPRPPPQEQVQKSGSIFPTPKLKVGAIQQGRPIQKKKALSPADPQDIQTHCRFSAEARDSPQPHRHPAAHTFPVGSTPVDMGGGGPAGAHEDQEGADFGAARSVEKMPVLGAEDWDFVGQLN